MVHLPPFDIRKPDALRRHPGSTYLFWAALWLLVFCLYLPAAKAGFVADFTGWLEEVRRCSFLDFVNRTGFHGRSLYQFTQACTWLLYQGLGVNAWGWHVVCITLHVCNCALVFRLLQHLIRTFGVQGAASVPFVGLALYCISPYLSETIVWEPSFHYLLGLLLLLSVLNCVGRYMAKGKTTYFFWGGAIYLLSCFSIEIFYITPWLVLAWVVVGKPVFPKAGTATRILLGFFVPQLLMFVGHLVLFNAVYGGWVAHIAGDVAKDAVFTGLGKPLKYLLNMTFLVRFFPEYIRFEIYDFCDNGIAIATTYGLFAASAFGLFRRRRGLTGKTRLAILLGAWVLLCLALLIPLWFGRELYVVYDRYVYFASAFFYPLLALGLTACGPKTRWALLLVFVTANLRFTVLVSRYWGKSERVVAGLLDSLPPNDGRTVLLLNLPQCLNGVPMIGAENESEFKLMHDLLRPQSKSGTVYDVLAYNMMTPNDGVHVVVLDDSTLEVTLNQWGSYWWFAGRGAVDYETDCYKVEILEHGNTGGAYRLTLKKPSEQLEVLFQEGSAWKEVCFGWEFEQY